MKLLKKNQITRLEEKAMSNLTGGAQDPCYAGCGWCTPGEGESGGARLAMSRAAASDRAGGATGSGGNPGGGAN